MDPVHKVKQIQTAVAEMDKVARQNMAEAEELSAAMAMFRTLKAR